MSFVPEASLARDTYDTGTDKDTVHAHLHHQRCIGGSGDTTGGEQDDGESFESRGFFEQVVGCLEILGEGVEFLIGGKVNIAGDKGVVKRTSSLMVDARRISALIARACLTALHDMLQQQNSLPLCGQLTQQRSHFQLHPYS